MEREKDMLKNKSAKKLGKSPLTCSHVHANLNPFEILFGSPPNTGIRAAAIKRKFTGQCEDEMLGLDCGGKAGKLQ